MPTVDTGSLTIAYTLHIPSQAQSFSTTTLANPTKYVVLINGLADPKETWSLQIPPLTALGYAVLTFDNRGIGATSSPPGPYTAFQLAADAKALVSALAISKFHLMGVSMGGMVAQAYALSYPSDLLSLTLACTYAAPGPFCSRMFALWADTAPVMGVPSVMRDVTLWAFTPAFFTDREAELREIETAMKYATQSTPAYLAQLAVIQDFDATERLLRHGLQEAAATAAAAAEEGEAFPPTLVLAGEQDILIPVSLSRTLHELIRGSRWTTVRGGHACLWEFPDSFNDAFTGFLESVEGGRSKSKND